MHNSDGVWIQTVLKGTTHTETTSTGIHTPPYTTQQPTTIQENEQNGNQDVGNDYKTWVENSKAWEKRKQPA